MVLFRRPPITAQAPNTKHIRPTTSPVPSWYIMLLCVYYVCTYIFTQCHPCFKPMILHLYIYHIWSENTKPSIYSLTIFVFWMMGYRIRMHFPIKSKMNEWRKWITAMCNLVVDIDVSLCLHRFQNIWIESLLSENYGKMNTHEIIYPNFHLLLILPECLYRDNFTCVSTIQGHRCTRICFWNICE